MIRQFDVVPNPIRAQRAEQPFLVNVQHAFLAGSSRRVLVPLTAPSAITPIPRLNPSFVIKGQPLLFMPVDVVVLPVRILGEPIANLEAERDRIIASLDLVWTGI
jgi:hypothetical protein